MHLPSSSAKSFTSLSWYWAVSYTGFWFLSNVLTFNGHLRSWEKTFRNSHAKLCDDAYISTWSKQLHITASLIWTGYKWRSVDVEYFIPYDLIMTVANDKVWYCLCFYSPILKDFMGRSNKKNPTWLWPQPNWSLATSVLGGCESFLRKVVTM